MTVGCPCIDLRRGRHAEILPKYKCVIHECTFLGPPTDALDASSRRKGHTHYAQVVLRASNPVAAPSLLMTLICFRIT